MHDIVYMRIACLREPSHTLIPEHPEHPERSRLQAPNIQAEHSVKAGAGVSKLRALPDVGMMQC